MIKSIEKEFRNYYSGKSDKISLEYELPRGIGFLSDARRAVSRMGLDPELFAYVMVDGVVLPVTMELLGNQIVLSGEKCWYRSGKYGLNGFSGKEGYVDFSDIETIPTKIQTPRVNQWWKNEAEKDIRTLFSVEIVRGKLIPEEAVSDSHCLILLAKIMFATKIPVFKLNVMDAYFTHSPSRWKLWKSGVYAYNPYTEEAEYRSAEEINDQRKRVENELL